MLVSNEETTTTSIPLCPSATNADGRRIYVHQDSFAHLAKSAAQHASEIYLCLGQVAMLKAVYQNFMEDGTMLMVLSKSEAHSMMNEARGRWGDPLNLTLRKLVYSPQDPKERHAIYPLLNQGEQIVASCYDDCYYTYSTSDAAARRMYADREDIQKLKKLVREKTGEFDLTMINGSALLFYDPDIGCGVDKLPEYRRKHGAGAQKPDTAGLVEIKLRIFEKLNRELRQIVDQIWPEATGERREFIEEAYETCCGALNKGILKYKPS